MEGNSLERRREGLGLVESQGKNEKYHTKGRREEDKRPYREQ